MNIKPCVASYAFTFIIMSDFLSFIFVLFALSSNYVYLFIFFFYTISPKSSTYLINHKKRSEKSRK